MRTDVASYYFTLWARTAALVTLAGSIISLFVLSGPVLDSIGYSYDVEGGSVVGKVHPATLLVALTLVLRIISENDVIDGIKRIFLGDGALLVAFAAFVILEVYTISALRVPVTPPIDTYLLPVLFCFALRGLNARCVRVLAIIILALFAANAIFAIYERIVGTRLFFVIPDDITGHPEDPTMKFDWKGHLRWDWRSTAMLGHPLENAMMTGCLIVILQSRACRWIPLVLRSGMIILQLAAMLTFGGRVALVLVGLVSGLWWFLRAGQAIRRGNRLSPRLLGGAFGVVPIVAASCIGLYLSGAIDKLIERFADDEGSAQTRLTMWRLFKPVRWDDIFTGPNPDIVATHQRLQGLELGIESFWAGLPLTYGIVMTLIILVSWIALSLYLLKTTRRESLFAIAFYFGVASTSAGLASKTTSLGFFAVLVLILMWRPATGAKPLMLPATTNATRAKVFPYRPTTAVGGAWEANISAKATATGGAATEKFIPPDEDQTQARV